MRYAPRGNSFAYTTATGRIEISNELPAGAVMLLTGNPYAITQRLTEHYGLNERPMTVPGTNAGNDLAENYRAIHAFAKRLKADNPKPLPKPAF